MLAANSEIVSPEKKNPAAISTYGGVTVHFSRFTASESKIAQIGAASVDRVAGSRQGGIEKVCWVVSDIRRVEVTSWGIWLDGDRDDYAVNWPAVSS